MSCKAVFDTNIFLSAILFGGTPEVLMRAARARRIELFTSPEILGELASILERKFRWADKDFREVVVAIGRQAALIKSDQKIAVLDDDPDNRV